MTIRSTFFLGILTFSVWLSAQQHPAAFVWKDPAGEGRQQTVLFRRSFDLKDKAGQAMIHLFADSRYHLHVNGTHINFGPSRFYPAHPEYDSYDLTPFLLPGRNVVAVEVLSNGTVTFQVPLSQGGFIAWGEVTSPKDTISLDTPGHWKMKTSAAYDHEALRFSFACGPMEIFDGRRQPADWNRPGFDDSHWESPVLHGNPDHWGQLAPRTIPPLTQDELLPVKLLGIYPEHHEEELYTFIIKTPDRTRNDYGSGHQMYACTYIFSPVQQDVELGLWWGTYYLNGEGPLEVVGSEPGNPVRQNRVLSLKEGWNFLFISYVAIWGGWDFYMAVPRKAGLHFSPFKKREGGPFIFTAGPFPRDAGIFNPESESPGDDLSILGNASYHWTPRESLSPGPNPARDLVWRKPDLERNLKSNDYQLSDFTVEEPVMMVFDMGGKKLGRLFVEVEARQGAIIDMAWSEDLNELGMPFLYKRLQINAGARFITSDGWRRYETFKPYGARYLLVRIDPGPAPGILKRVGMTEQVYPFLKNGSFSCSHPVLDRIWEMGWRTLRVCSEDAYTDTPFRERGLYAGDALPEYGITLAASGDSRLMKRSLLLFQDMYRDQMMHGKEEGLNDFVLKTLLELYWYYQVTGDKEFLQDLYPSYRSLLQHIMKKKNKSGFYSTGRVFIEWTKIDKQADLTAYQALVAGSFQIMAWLAEELDRTEDSEMFASEAARAKSLINEHFWDGAEQVYRDGYKGDSAINHHYPISSVYPLLFNLCSEEQKSSLFAFFEKELQDIGEETRNRKITPYGAFYLFAVLFRGGQTALAERFMLQYWSRMIHQGDDTSWENFDIAGAEQGGQGTASHAWSGHPTYFLSTEVLGVQLGFSRPFNRNMIEIMPQSEILSWARGTVPHPAGLVYVDWRIQGQRLVMRVTIPEGVDYQVRPRGRLSELTLDLDVKIENPF